MSTVTNILLMFTCIILKTTNTITITRTATVDENNLQNNGAVITTYPGSYSCQSATCWAIYADDSYNRGFHLKLSLDSFFNFHPSYITNLTIKIYYNTNTNWPNGRDLVVVFNQEASNKYFVTRMAIDMSNDHGIYPRFSSLGNAPNFADYAYGNPETLVDEYNSQYSRFYKLHQKQSYWIYSPSRASNERNVQSPLTFTLQNHPSSYLVYSYTNPGETIRSCGFPAMSTNFPLNIYLAADFNQAYDSLNIEKIKITHTYDVPTQNPTTSPTLLPSENPSNQPTISPITTLYPTDSPSVIATDSPTKTPTVFPSINPTISPTDNPTISPTNNPTISPTKTPTVFPSIKPTIQPTETDLRTTIQPTEKRIVAEDSMETTFSGENSRTIALTNTIILIDENVNRNHNVNIFGLDIWKIVVMTVFILSFCILCLLGCKIVKKRRALKEKKYVIHTTEHIQNNKPTKISIASNSTTSVAMSRLSANPSLNSTKIRTTSTLINQYIHSQDVVPLESCSNGDMCVITAGNIDEDTGDTGDTGDDTGDTGDTGTGTGTGTGTDDDVTPTRSSMMDDRIVSNGDATPYGDLMEMDDEKYNHMFDQINHKYKRSLHSNISFSDRHSNTNNQFLPIMPAPFQNASIPKPKHRRIFSEGPKDIVKKITIDGDENLKEDEFIIVGEDGMNSDDDMTPSEQQTVGNED